MTYRYWITEIEQDRERMLDLTLAENVRSIRHEQGISRSMLASACNMSRSMLVKIEMGGADVRLSYVKRIADALCVEPIALLQDRRERRSTPPQ